MVYGFNMQKFMIVYGIIYFGTVHIVMDADSFEVNERFLTEVEVLIGLVILLKTVFRLLIMVPRCNKTADDSRPDTHFVSTT